METELFLLPGVRKGLLNLYLGARHYSESIEFIEHSDEENIFLLKVSLVDLDDGTLKRALNKIKVRILKHDYLMQVLIRLIKMQEHTLASKLIKNSNPRPGEAYYDQVLLLLAASFDVAQPGVCDLVMRLAKLSKLTVCSDSNESLLEILFSRNAYSLIEDLIKRYVDQFPRQHLANIFIRLAVAKEVDLLKRIRRLLQSARFLEHRDFLMFLLNTEPNKIAACGANRDQQGFLSLLLNGGRSDLINEILKSCNKDRLLPEICRTLKRLSQRKESTLYQKLLCKIDVKCWDEIAKFVDPTTGSTLLHDLMNAETVDVRLVKQLMPFAALAKEDRQNNTIFHIALRRKIYPIVEEILKARCYMKDFSQEQRDGFLQSYLDRAIEEKIDENIFRDMCVSFPDLFGDQVLHEIIKRSLVGGEGNFIARAVAQKPSLKQSHDKEGLTLLHNLIAQPVVDSALVGEIFEHPMLFQKDKSGISVLRQLLEKKDRQLIEQIIFINTWLFSSEQWQEIWQESWRVTDAELKLLFSLPVLLQHGLDPVHALTTATQQENVVGVKEVYALPHFQKYFSPALLKNAWSFLVSKDHSANINLNILTMIEGNDVYEKRKIAIDMIDYVLKQAKTGAAVHEVVEALEKNIPHLDYLHKRQRNCGLSLASHHWKGQGVSHTWVKIMELAKNRIVALSHEGYVVTEKDKDMLSKKTHFFGLFDTNWMKKIKEPLEVAARPPQCKQEASG